MAYISDLAKELNKKEGIVINMLKKRGYLKENGTPRKATINSGLMREDGFIYKKGIEQFMKELGMEKDNKEAIGLGEKTIRGNPPAEAFLCPSCDTVMLQKEALRQKKTNEFIFQCKNCKKIYKITLNNITCANCKLLVKADIVYRKKFCSKECFDFYTDQGYIPVPDYIFQDSSSKTNNCLYCKKGCCKNDENPHCYDKKCPGDCDYYQRK